MSNIIFLQEAWDDYIYWQAQDKKTLHRINLLLKDISRNAFEGIGKPEPLKGNMSGWWSRHIDDSNRIVYRVISNESIEISQCRGHYSDK
jgi:toxin YoeB